MFKYYYCPKETITLINKYMQITADVRGIPIPPGNWVYKCLGDLYLLHTVTNERFVFGANGALAVYTKRVGEVPESEINGIVSKLKLMAQS